MFVSSGRRASVWVSDATAAANVGDEASGRPSLLCTSTDSVAGERKFAPRSIVCACAVSPEPDCESPSSFRPIARPAAKATNVNTIQPNAAVFQCAALQRPARPARFVFSATLRRYVRRARVSSVDVAEHAVDLFRSRGAGIREVACALRRGFGDLVELVLRHAEVAQPLEAALEGEHTCPLDWVAADRVAEALDRGRDERAVELQRRR